MICNGTKLHSLLQLEKQLIKHHLCLISCSPIGFVSEYKTSLDLIYI